MGADRIVRWGPPALSTVVADQLQRHGLGSADAVACAQELASAVGPAARASSFVDLGGCRFLGGDISGALAAWQQAIVSGQRAPAARALFNLGLLHEHLGLYGDAIERFEAVEAHAIAPYATLATVARARALHRDGQHERAMAALARHADRLIEQDPGGPFLAETMLGLGDVAEAAGQLERAEQAYRAATDAADDTIREQATLALVDVLRFMGHDEEAQQLVEDAGLAAADPMVALDRIELLVRLARFEEAETVLGELATDELGVAEQFRLTSIQIDLGRVNDAIDILEALTGTGAGETRARAAYRLGEVYLAHDMAEPAATMFANVRGLQSGYWADKASLMLGDLAIADGRHRIAAAHWADAAASRVESVSSVARARLVEAVATPVGPQTPGGEHRGDVDEAMDTPVHAERSDALDTPVELDVPVEAAGTTSLIHEQDGDDLGPRTEAVDMTSLLDEDLAVDDLADEDPAEEGHSESDDRDELDPSWRMPGEITPVAGILMTLPIAEPVDVVIPAEPLAGEPLPLAPPVASSPTAAAPTSEPVEPSVPTVIPLRRRAASEDPIDLPPEPVVQPTPEDVGPIATDDVAATEDAAALAAPLVIKLGRSKTAPPHAEPVAGDMTGDVEDAASSPTDEAVADDETGDSEDSEASADAVPNPYADLAPEALADDPTPSRRNPYAELAPNFTRDPLDLEIPDDEEPGPSTFSQFA